MTSRLCYEAILIELNKENAPNILLEDFNYLFNKAINQYINKRYNIYDISQQTTDDLRVLKATSILPVNKAEMYDNDVMGRMMGATYEVNLPMDYLHLLNCICIYKVNKTFKCYNKGDIWRRPATRLTSDIYSQVLDNFWMRPTYRRPYYYIHNVNYDSKNNKWTTEIPTNPYDYVTKEGTDADFTKNSTKLKSEFRKISGIIDGHKILSQLYKKHFQSKINYIPEKYDNIYLWNGKKEKTSAVIVNSLYEEFEISLQNEELFENKNIGESEPVLGNIAFESTSKGGIIIVNGSEVYYLNPSNISIKFIDENNVYKYSTNDGLILWSIDENSSKDFYEFDESRGFDANNNLILNGDSSLKLWDSININERETSNVERASQVRYGNASKVRLELRYGTDDSLFLLTHVYIDYIKAPLNIRLTLEQLDLTEDTSQMLEFPDYVCQEIINELVNIVMENISDLRLQTHPVVSLSIANPAQQLTADQLAAQ